MGMKVRRDALHCFVATTARRFGLASRATINNRTGEPVLVMARVRDEDGQAHAGPVEVGSVDAGDDLHVDLGALVGNGGSGLPGSHSGGAAEAREHVVTFSLIPQRFLEGPETVDIEPAQMFRQILAQDHYLEHYDPGTGFSSGVLYQTPPLNRIGQPVPSSFLMQAPKAFVTGGRRTVFQFLHYSPDPDYAQEATLSCRALAADGGVLAAWHERFPPHALRFVDVGAVLQAHGHAPADVTDQNGFVYVEAACDHAGFVPLTWNLFPAKGTFDLEHSLPPVYYGPVLSGARKQRMVEAVCDAVAAAASAPA